MNISGIGKRVIGGAISTLILASGIGLGFQGTNSNVTQQVGTPGLKPAASKSLVQSIDDVLLDESRLELGNQEVSLSASGEESSCQGLIADVAVTGTAYDGTHIEKDIQVELGNETHLMLPPGEYQCVIADSLADDNAILMPAKTAFVVGFSDEGASLILPRDEDAIAKREEERAEQERARQEAEEAERARAEAEEAERARAEAEEAERARAEAEEAEHARSGAVVADQTNGQTVYITIQAPSTTAWAANILRTASMK